MLPVAMAAVPFVLSLRERAKGVIEDVNQKCIELEIPPAFDVGSLEEAQSLDEVYLKGNPDFRFEGFGIVIGLRPKLSFWVHYKKNTPEHQDLGKFLMDLKALSALSMNLLPAIGNIGQLIDRVDDVVELVEGKSGLVEEVVD